MTAYDELESPSANALTFAVCAIGSDTFTTSALAGEINATISFLASAMSITFVAYVSPVASALVCEGPQIKKLMSIV